MRAGTALALAALLVGCSEPAAVRTLRAYPLENLDGVLTRSGVAFDAEQSADGNGSLRIAFDGPAVIRLYETGALDVQNTLLTYRARLRTEDVRGRAYLEMWCDFPGRGEFFSRALTAPLTGTTDWTSQQAPFFLKDDLSPDNVKLNLVVEGSGTVWIDDIVLEAAPLE